MPKAGQRLLPAERGHDGEESGGRVGARQCRAQRLGDLAQPDPFALGERELARFRNDVVGFVFQEHHLLPQLDVLENVLIPTLAFGEPGEEDEERARELIERVGLSQRLGHRPGQLSGGERQRAAVAQALIRRPRLLLCDEPTGSLDRTTAGAVADLIFELHGQEGALLLLATHDEGLARRCDRVLELRDGRCSEA